MGKAGQDKTLTSRIERGAGLLFLSMMGIRLIGIGSIAVLGRLLTPVDFGIVALAMLMTGLTQAISERQFDLVLIRTKDPEPADFDTAFSLAAGWGLVAGVVVAASAPVLGWAFDNPDVLLAMLGLALVPLIDGMRNPYFVVFEKDLKFGRMASVDVGGRAATAIVSVAMAVLLGNYWALVLGQIAFSVFRTGMSHLLVRQRPAFGLSRWRRFSTIVGWLMATNIVDYLNRRAATAFIGFGLDTRFAGQFRMGEDLSTMATQQLGMPLRRVLMPGFSKIGEDRARLVRAFFKAQGTILGVMLPIGVGLALIAPEAIRLAVGPQWGQAAVVVQILAPVFAFSTVAGSTKAILLSHGDIRHLFQRSVAMFVITTPIMLGGLWWQGALGIVMARAAASVIRTMMTLHIITSLLQIAIWAPLAASWRSFAAAVCMVGAVALASPHLPASGSLADLGIALVAKVGVGALSYSLVHAGLWLATGRPDGVEAVLMDFLRRRLKTMPTGRGGR